MSEAVASEPVGAVALLAWNSIVEIMVGIGVVITIVGAVWRLKGYLDASSKRAVEAVIKDNVILETNLRSKINDVEAKVQSAHICITNLEKEMGNTKEMLEEKHDNLTEDLDEIKSTVKGNSQRITDHIITSDKEKATMRYDIALIRRDMDSRTPVRQQQQQQQKQGKKPENTEDNTDQSTGS